AVGALGGGGVRRLGPLGGARPPEGRAWILRQLALELAQRGRRLGGAPRLDQRRRAGEAEGGRPGRGDGRRQRDGVAGDGVGGAPVGQQGVAGGDGGAGAGGIGR